MVSTAVRTTPPAVRPLEHALSLGSALVDRVRDGDPAWITASLVSGPAIILGAHQLAERVVDLDRCNDHGVAVHRRATGGTAVHIAERGLLFTLALPHVAALAPDATYATLLNRNVRGFLQGLTRCGATAHYYGREWIAVRQRPGAVLGFEVTEDGGVLIEVLAGYDAPVTLPAALQSARESVGDRWLGKAPIALSDATGGKAPEQIAARVMESCATRWKQPLIDHPLDPLPIAATRVTRPLDPLADGMVPVAQVPCAIGWIDAARGWSPNGHEALWIGGDVLAPRHALERLARRFAAGDALDEDGAAPALEGARWADLVRALELTSRATGHGR